MTDERLGRIERQHQADPDNRELTFALLQARARVDGPLVYQALLDDRELWNEAPESAQDLAVESLSAQLAPAFQFISLQYHHCAGLTHRVACYQHQRTGSLFHLIPAGRFIMGSDDDDAYDDERPAHAAHISAPFLLARTPLEQQAWDQIGGHDERAWRDPQLPIEGVSFTAIEVWLNTVNEETGPSLRLPTEAEWEYACRAGSQSAYFWGPEMDASYCWYHGNSDGRTHPAHEHNDKTNAFGLIDMLGNVSEWCQDTWSLYQRPEPAPAASERVIRGGGWIFMPRGCRSTFRGKFEPTVFSTRLGVRLACSLT